METSLIGKALDFGSSEYRFESYVSNIIHFKNPYLYLLNHLKFSLAKKLFFFNLPLLPQSLELLRLLLNLKVIRRFSRLRGTTYSIFPSYSKYGQPIKYLKAYYRLRNPILVKFKALTLLNKSLGASSILIETSSGIMTHKEALKQKVGGILVCTIL